MVAKADAENRVAYEMCERSSEDAGRHVSHVCSIPGLFAAGVDILGLLDEYYDRREGYRVLVVFDRREA